jgi:hypothetical protein
VVAQLPGERGEHAVVAGTTRLLLEQGAQHVLDVVVLGDAVLHLVPGVARLRADRRVDEVLLRLRVRDEQVGHLLDEGPDVRALLLRLLQEPVDAAVLVLDD